MVRVKNDACYCLCCYLCANDSETSSHGGRSSFTGVDFKVWNNMKRHDKHIGEPNSTHNQCVKICEDLIILKHSMNRIFLNVNFVLKFVKRSHYAAFSKYENSVWSVDNYYQ